MFRVIFIILKLTFLFPLVAMGMNEPQQALPTVSVFAPCKTCDQEAKHLCSACKTVKYCSINCQKLDFPSHKLFCHKMRPYKDLAGGVRIATSNIPNSGNGLFALKNFGAGEKIAAYVGDAYADTAFNRMKFGSHAYFEKPQMAISQDTPILR